MRNTITESILELQEEAAIPLCTLLRRHPPMDGLDMSAHSCQIFLDCFLWMATQQADHDLFRTYDEILMVCFSRETEKRKCFVQKSYHPNTDRNPMKKKYSIVPTRDVYLPS